IVRVEIAGLTPVRALCRQIQSQATARATTATPVIQTCALPSQASTPPTPASRTAGSAKGKTHTAQAATAPAAERRATPPAALPATPALRLAFVAGAAAQ